MGSFCNHSEINYPYYVNVPVNIRTPPNNDTCWLKCDPSLSPSNVTDTSFLLSENESITAGILATLASIPGTILNFLIILAIIRSADLRKEYLAPSIASIAVTDFVFSVYVLPSSAIHNIKRNINWIEGCNVIGPIALGLWMVSVFNLIGIAGLRCFAINYPMKTKNKSFQYCCMAFPIIGWLSTLIFFLPSLTQQYGRFGLQCRVFLCALINVDTEGNPITPDPTALYFNTIFFGGISLIFLNILSYVQVSRQTKKLFDQIKATSADEAKKVLRHEKKLGKMVGYITASFVLVYVPLILVLAIFPNVGYKYPVVGIISYFFSYLLVVVDPLIYIFCSEKYRDEIKMILNPILSRISKLKANDISGKETQTQVTSISQTRT